MNLLLFAKKKLTAGIALALNFTGETLDSRVSFSRTSNATRVNAQGLIEYAPHNLLTYSENFDNAVWAKSNATVTANAIVAPDGTTTADKLVENTAASVPHGLAVDTSSLSSTTQYTFSVYAKAGERTWVRLGLVDNLGTDGGRAWFDLSTGVVGTVEINGAGSNIDATITSIGAGWCRCRLTIQMNNGKTTLQSQVRLATANNVLSYTGDGTSGIYICGAQLNIGSLQPYYTTSVKNLLGYSQNFENAAWAKINSSIAASTVIGPFGFDGGQKLVEGTVSGTPYISENNVVNAGVPYTISVYAKESQQTPKRYVALLFPSSQFGSNKRATFDLSAGTYVTTNSPDSASITPIGNGWYRCQVSATCVTSGTTNTQIRIATTYPDNLTPYTGDGTSGIYIFGAQLSDSASLDPYSYNPVAAPTSTAYYGPRFDYDPVTLAPKGLLIEEQRTNLLTYSSEFENTAWLKARSTIITNAITAPDGSITADKLVEDTTASNTHNVSELITTIASTTYTLSCYLKKGERSWAVLVFNNAGVYPAVYIDLNSGVIGNISGNITATISPIGAGWYRCTATVIATSTNLTSYILTSIGNGNQVYTGDGTSGIYLWGAQLEAGAFPTSYIPTTSATVTRAADNASMVGSNFSSWYNQSEGTVVVSADSAGGLTPCMLSLDDGTGNNRIQLRRTSNNTMANFRLVSPSNSIDSTLLNSSVSGTNKQAAAFINSAQSAAANGILFTGITPVATLPNVNQMVIGNAISATWLNGHIQFIKFFSKRFIDTYLQRLTR